jgi:hypothetical protein
VLAQVRGRQVLARGHYAQHGEPEAVAEEPATTALDPTGKVETSASFKKFKLVGSNGKVDISTKENMDSLNTT